jgi:hypothetical protein
MDIYLDKMNLNCKREDYRVFEHLQDKKIKEGVHVYVQAGLAKNLLPPSVTFLAALSPSLNTLHFSRSKSETWSRRGD